jgi:RNA polymerase sigma factor (sigma-70 family)
LDAVERAGYRSLKQFCEIEDLPYNTIAELVRMGRAAISPVTGDWTRTARSLARVLGYSPEDLFTEAQARSRVRPTKEIRVDEEALAAFADRLAGAVRPDDALEKKEGAELIGDAVETLPERVKTIIKQRYGLGGEEEHTLSEIADKHGICAERARALAANGLKLLRHPSRSASLKELLD